MSPHGGKRPGQRGREKRPRELHYQRRYVSLPPEIAQLLDQVPEGERSRLVADLLRVHFELVSSQGIEP